MGFILANRIQLTIAGVSLVVSTAEEESYVARIAESVDRDMQTLLSQTKASVTSAALLLAIDYMDRFQKANRSATNMRTQIKGYLADAANAKLQFDSERKRADTYAAEAEELRKKLDSTPLPLPISSGLSQSDFDELTEERDALLNQLEHANRMLKAVDNSSRDAEIIRLKDELRDHLDRIGSQSKQISGLEQLLLQRQDEIDRFKTGLEKSEKIIDGGYDVEHIQESFEPVLEPITLSERKTDETASEADSPQVSNWVEDNGLAQGSVEDEDEEDFTADDIISGFKQSLPPLYRQNPADDATYDFEDLPNLNWTDDI